MRSGTCPFISPFMDKRIFLPKESTRHSSLDKNTMKNNNNLVQSRSQFCQTRAMNVMVCKWDGQRKGTLHLSYLIKSKHLKGRLDPPVSDEKCLSVTFLLIPAPPPYPVQSCFDWIKHNIWQKNDLKDTKQI